MSGPAITLQLYFSSVITTITIPFVARFCLSRRTILPTSPTPSPSTRIVPVSTWPAISYLSSDNETTVPDVTMIT